MNTRLQISSHANPNTSSGIQATGFLQRKCACGGTPGASDECAECHKKRLADQSALIQPKLRVNQPGDRYEKEADRVADRVMQMPAPAIQRQAQTEDDDEEILQTKSAFSQTANGDIVNPSLSSRIHAVRGGGQPLDLATREFMEPRFGHDFSQVRIHTGNQASEMARQVNAQAFTLGRDVVFGTGQYVPGTSKGQSLLAHELTHVVQQTSSLQKMVPMTGSIAIGDPDEPFEREADQVAFGANRPPHDMGVSTPSIIQRACGARAIMAITPPGCSVGNHTFVPGTLFKFNVNCDEFARGQEATLISFASALPPTATLEIHSYASVDAATFNEQLSCARSSKALSVLTAAPPGGAGISTSRITIVNHGPTPGPAAERRSVTIRTTEPAPPQKCGPDATDWFIRQVSVAKRDPVIIALQARLLGAERVARRFGFSAERIAEGAVARRVLAEEARVSPPPRTAEATTQLTASIPGQREFGRALVAASVPIVGAPEALVLAAIRGAALTWKGLVGTGRKYDFKNSARTLQSPNSANCPVDCPNTITLCGTTSSDCFVKDVPGNLFYAHIGRFVGWTELALQLGSQFAQLESSARWDPPEDTRMISFGFGLPDPLSRSDLCAAINSNRSIFNIQNCQNCDEELQADVV